MFNFDVGYSYPASLSRQSNVGPIPVIRASRNESPLIALS